MLPHLYGATWPKPTREACQTLGAFDPESSRRRRPSCMAPRDLQHDDSELISNGGFEGRMNKLRIFERMASGFTNLDQFEPEHPHGHRSGIEEWHHDPAESRGAQAEGIAEKPSLIRPSSPPLRFAEMHMTTAP